MADDLDRFQRTVVKLAELSAELKALADLPDDQIDLSDIPEQTDWSNAIRGAFGNPDAELPEGVSAKELVWLGAMAKANRYLAPVPLGGGHWAAISQFAFTVGILVGDMFDDYGYSDRFCFDRLSTALRALAEWRNRDFEGEPIGWHRHPDSGRRRPGGDQSKEYVNP